MRERKSERARERESERERERERERGRERERERERREDGRERERERERQSSMVQTHGRDVDLIAFCQQGVICWFQCRQQRQTAGRPP